MEIQFNSNLEMNFIKIQKRPCYQHVGVKTMLTFAALKKIKIP